MSVSHSGGRVAGCQQCVNVSGSAPATAMLPHSRENAGAQQLRLAVSCSFSWAGSKPGAGHHCGAAVAGSALVGTRPWMPNVALRQGAAATGLSCSGACWQRWAAADRCHPRATLAAALSQLPSPRRCCAWLASCCALPALAGVPAPARKGGRASKVGQQQRLAGREAAAAAAGAAPLKRPYVRSASGLELSQGLPDSHGAPCRRLNWRGGGTAQARRPNQAPPPAHELRVRKSYARAAVASSNTSSAGQGPGRCPICGPRCQGASRCRRDDLSEMAHVLGAR